MGGLQKNCPGIGSEFPCSPNCGPRHRKLIHHMWHPMQNIVWKGRRARPICRRASCSYTSSKCERALKTKAMDGYWNKSSTESIFVNLCKACVPPQQKKKQCNSVTVWGAVKNSTNKTIVFRLQKQIFGMSQTVTRPTDYPPPPSQLSRCHIH